MGHGFTGEILEVGFQVRQFRKADRVVSPFTVSCGKCFYCEHDFSSRCSDSKLYGTIALDGGQAEYVRVPLADWTLVRVPASIDEKMLVLMADIFPTGYAAVSQELHQSRILDCLFLAYNMLSNGAKDMILYTQESCPLVRSLAREVIYYCHLLNTDSSIWP